MKNDEKDSPKDNYNSEKIQIVTVTIHMSRLHKTTGTKKTSYFTAKLKLENSRKIYFQISSGSPDNIIDEDTFSKIKD